MKELKVVEDDRIRTVYINPQNIVSAARNERVRQKLMEEHEDQLSDATTFSDIVVEAGGQRQIYTVVGPPSMFGGKDILHG